MTAPATVAAPATLTDLKALPAWLCWRLYLEPGATKPRKVPHYPASGRRRQGRVGSPEDRAQLVPYEQALAAAKVGGYDGVGFCPLPEWGVTALDFDNCVKDGQVRDDVQRLVTGTYAEFSPSGTGVRAFVRAALGDYKDHDGQPYGLELFNEKGYVTFTGRELDVTHLTETSDTIAEPSQELLDAIADRFARKAIKEAAEPAEVAPLGLTREQLQQALEVLDASMGHDPWLRVGMALHHETSGEGFDLWDTWSARGAQYPGTEALQARWESFGRGGQRPVTAQALVRMANENGAGLEVAQLEAADDFEAIEPAAVQPADTISFVDFGDLAHRMPPPRQWVLDQYIPRKAVTSMFGRGGHGKSLLAQQLALCVALGLPFAGRQTTRGPVLGLFAEDDTDEMLRRGAALYSAMGLALGAGRESLFLDARAGKPNTLVSFTPSHTPRSTDLMKALRERCQAIRPVLIVLDNIAQLYAGEENNRHEVTAFCNELTGLACAFDAAVLLLGHLAKAEESEYSGSTAWDAAVRSRLLLARQVDGTTLLRKVKANYSALDEVRLEWRSGAFTHVPGLQELGPAALDDVKPYIVRALQVLTGRKQAASHLPTARNYLVKLMREEVDLHASVRPELLQAALRAMLDSGEVQPEAPLPWKSKSRHAVTGLALPA